MKSESKAPFPVVWTSKSVIESPNPFPNVWFAELAQDPAWHNVKSESSSFWHYASASGITQSGVNGIPVRADSVEVGQGESSSFGDHQLELCESLEKPLVP